MDRCEPYLRTLAMLCVAALLLLFAVLSTASRNGLPGQSQQAQILQSSASLSSGLSNDTDAWRQYTAELLRNPDNDSARRGLQRLFFQYVALANQASEKGDTTLQNKYLDHAMNLLEGRHPATHLSVRPNRKI